MITKHVYSGCNKKLAAREITIINTYREIFQQHSLPEDKQFISLCGLCCDTDKGNILLKDSELEHILREKIITNPSQYHGIDASIDTIAANKLISDFAQTEDKPNWYNKFFSQAFNEISREKWFNPGIINFDCTAMPEKAIGDIKRIINQTSKVDNVLLVCNLVTRARSKICTPEQLFDIINKSGLRKTLMENNWILPEAVYVYNGTGKRSNTTMTTFIAYKINEK